MPIAEELFRMAKALGVTMEWLLTGDGTKASSPELKQPSKAAIRKALAAAKAAILKAESELDPPA